ncbi:unnamed protein product, partial [Iphiclides podalirius]
MHTSDTLLACINTPKCYTSSHCSTFEQRAPRHGRFAEESIVAVFVDPFAERAKRRVGNLANAPSKHQRGKQACFQKQPRRRTKGLNEDTLVSNSFDVAADRAVSWRNCPSRAGGRCGNIPERGGGLTWGEDAKGAAGVAGSGKWGSGPETPVPDRSAHLWECSRRWITPVRRRNATKFVSASLSPNCGFDRLRQYRFYRLLYRRTTSRALKTACTALLCISTCVSMQVSLRLTADEQRAPAEMNFSTVT